MSREHSRVSRQTIGWGKLGFFRTVLLTTSVLLFWSSLMAICNTNTGVNLVDFIATAHAAVEGGETGGRGNNEDISFFEDLSTLEEVWSVLKPLVPNRGTDGYIQPGANVVADFERIVLDMMMIGHPQSPSRLDPPSPQPSCGQIDLRSLKGMYRIGTFIDQDNGRSYCILATTSIRYPWGNVIVDLDGTTTKNLSFDCPHPKYDADTGEQGMRMLKGTTARSWIVSGSHRMANNRAYGVCQPDHSYYASDVAHSDDNCFLSAVAAIKFYYESRVHEDYTSVQLHGMGKSTCGSIDTFFSHGSCSENVPYEYTSDHHMEKIDILQNIAMAHPSDHGQHAIASKDGSGCKMCGSLNTEGRLINGVARNDLCNTSASSYNGRFVQIEQKRDYRRDSFAQFWNDVFNEAYPQFSVVTI